jgi:hypothetical protein
MSEPVNFEHSWIRFGEGAERWSAPDPTTERNCDGRYAARYSDPPNYSAAEQAEIYHYLTWICSTTEDAVQKLRAIRRALREK